ncbi:MAG: penicillin-binding protein 2 [Anaerolineales bacterium]|nr:penicillin-binding protein 2 [Anaerolineales bacterium]
MSSNTPSKNTIESWRVLTYEIAIGVVFLIFVVRLFDFQILQGAEFLTEAEINRTETINLPTSRGNIYDRNGVILARNAPAYNVVITPAQLPDDTGEIQEIFRAVAELVDVPVNLGEINDETPFSPCISEHGINQIVTYGETTNPFRAVEIKCDIDETTAMIIQEKSVDLPGVGIEVQSVREYPTGSLTAALIGFLGPIPADSSAAFEALGFITDRDKIGYAGIEVQFQDLLGGRNGLREVEVDVAGQILRDISPPIPAIPGQNIYLTIDTRLQDAATEIVNKELDFWNEFYGRENKYLSSNAVVIAINPQTGEILTMVSVPTYENNRFARVIPLYYYEQLIADLRLPLFNHAISAAHPPGSIFKLITATGALNEGAITADQIILTPGEIVLEEKFFAGDFNRTPINFVDWVNRNGEQPEGFGSLDFVSAIARSSNVYFYKVGGGYQDEVPDGLGICDLKAYANALGVERLTGIELPGETVGLIPDPRWKRTVQGENWSTGDTYLASVGQGFLSVTPMQMLMVAATIANDGRMMQPTIVREIVDGEGNVTQPFAPDLVWDTTIDPVVEDFVQYVSGTGACQGTGIWKTIAPYVFETVQQGMRLAVTENPGSRGGTDPGGTLWRSFQNFPIAAAGKTGTAEYCDAFARTQNRCVRGQWPSHAWTLAYAPFDNPEIAVVAFVYNGTEGATVAGPIAAQVIKAYFELKALNTTP